MRLDVLNTIGAQEAVDAFTRCCGAREWARAMASARPFRDRAHVFEVAERVADELERADWLEAFAHHPRIGDRDALRQRFAATAVWAGDEQRGAASASEDVLDRLARGNDAYARRFGYIFIVCATGRGADDMLQALEARLGNPDDVELTVAAAEQRKITRLRLEKLMEEP